MDDITSTFLETKRYAVVTGANKGMGFEVCKQLASSGVTVILTARDPKRGLEALEGLSTSGLSELLHFHQLDVTDSESVAALADFVKAKFGKLDILVNNGGILGAHLDADGLRARAAVLEQVDLSIFVGNATQTYELAEACIDTNFYGVRRMVQALLPLLQLSDSPRIVNVSSVSGKLQFMQNEWAKGILYNIDNLTEEKLVKVVTEFLHDLKDGSHAEKGWSTLGPAYMVSKATLNAYTRLLAKTYPNISTNCVCPGIVRTSMVCGVGNFSAEEGAAFQVRLALVPNGASGLFFQGNEVASFD
ncbi:(+)-neomenthol dehydrogenase-like protein [Drosera capensis]